MILWEMRNGQEGKKGMTSDGTVDRKKGKRIKGVCGCQRCRAVECAGSYCRISELDTWESWRKGRIVVKEGDAIINDYRVVYDSG